MRAGHTAQNTTGVQVLSAFWLRKVAGQPCDYFNRLAFDLLLSKFPQIVMSILDDVERQGNQDWYAIFR